MASSKIVIYAALGANLAITMAKFIAAAITQSSAMLAEGIHSLVDTSNELLLLLGIRLSHRPPDEEHPFGHSRELYFWAFIVAVLIFGLGGGISVYQGILHLQTPTPIIDPTWNYIVLGIAVVFEGSSWILALRRFLEIRGNRGVWETIHTTKDPTIIVVLFEDSAALLGLFVAFLGIFFAEILDNPHFDGAASIIIGLILATVASMLAYETRGLLIGESADPHIVASIHNLVEQDPAVERVRQPLTIHLGPRNILLTLNVQFHSTLSADEVAATINRLEKAIRRQHPIVRQIFLEAESISANSALSRASAPEQKS
ncbi:MAG: cation diffusion facilitator family transporter [Candidatus Nitrosoglobus sp.]